MQCSVLLKLSDAAAMYPTQFDVYFLLSCGVFATHALCNFVVAECNMIKYGDFMDRIDPSVQVMLCCVE